MSDGHTGSYEPIQELKIEDRQYDLMSRACSSCGTEHFEIWRWSGASFARYKMPPDFTVDAFLQFVEPLDEQLLETAPDILEGFCEKLYEVNSSTGVEADFSFSFRLLEYARRRLATLDKLGVLEAIESVEEPKDASSIALRAAFELGSAAAEHRLMVSWEDYLHDGVAMSEWRNAGLPKARQERIRQGAKTRSAILKAASQLYQDHPELLRNDSETARRIIRLHLPGLQKGNNQQVGLDAITRHLRDARRTAKRPEN